MNKTDDTQTRQTRETIPKLDWNWWDMVFFVLPIGLVIFGRLAGFEYLKIRYSSFSAGFVALIVYPAIGIFLIYCFFANIVRLVGGWTRHSRSKRVLIVTEIGALIVLMSLFFAPCFMPIDSLLWVPGYKPFTYHFGEEIRSKADVEAIRDWLRTLSKEDCTGQTTGLIYVPGSFTTRWRDSMEWPEELKVFHPNYVKLDLDENGNPKIRLTWGAALGHWGVEIGVEGMEIPPSDFSQWGEYRLALEPGIYVWHELQ